MCLFDLYPDCKHRMSWPDLRPGGRRALSRPVVVIALEPWPGYCCLVAVRRGFSRFSVRRWLADSQRNAKEVRQAAQHCLGSQGCKKQPQKPADEIGSRPAQYALDGLG